MTFTNVASGAPADLTGISARAFDHVVNTAESAYSAAPLVQPASRWFVPVARIDDYHAKNTEYVIWQINGHRGKTNFSYNIGIHNHSANVDMSYFETSGVRIRLTWRLRIRHDIAAQPDTTVFTYPDVQGPSLPTQSYKKHEDRYGGGFNALPYQTNWKLFWDSYNLSLVYGGTQWRVAGSIQSDRVTCYKTVPCKFR